MSASVSSSIEVLLSCDGGGSAYRDCFSFLGQFFDHLGVTDWHQNSDSGHLLDHVEVIYQTGAISGYLGFLSRCHIASLRQHSRYCNIQPHVLPLNGLMLQAAIRYCYSLLQDYPNLHTVDENDNRMAAQTGQCTGVWLGSDGGDGRPNVKGRLFPKFCSLEGVEVKSCFCPIRANHVLLGL
jgi:hypothetical protein